MEQDSFTLWRLRLFCLQFLPEGCGCAALPFLEHTDQVVGRIKSQPVCNFGDAQIGGLQQHSGAFDLRVPDIITDGLAGLVLELFGQIVLGIADQGGQISGADLAVQR